MQQDQNNGGSVFVVFSYPTEIKNNINLNGYVCGFNCAPSVLENNSITSVATGEASAVKHRGQLEMYNDVIHIEHVGAFLFGLDLDDSGAEDKYIYNNTFYLEGSADVTGAYVDNNAGAEFHMDNNVFYINAGGESICYEEELTASDRPTSLKNNIFHGCKIAIYQEDSSGTPNNITDINLINDTIAGVTGNINSDPIFTDLASKGLTLGSTSPASVARIDGEAASWGFNTDFLGVTRTAPWSIGAYEK